MFTDLECKYSFEADRNFSAYLNIDRETTKILLINSIKFVFDFMKAILIDKEYENFKRGYLLRFLKSKIRNIKVILDSYIRFNKNSYHQVRYDSIAQAVYNVEFFFKHLHNDVYKMEEENRNQVYKGFCYQELSVIVYLSIQFFDLDMDIERETFRIIDDLVNNESN